MQIIRQSGSRPPRRDRPSFLPYPVQPSLVSIVTSSLSIDRDHTNPKYHHVSAPSRHVEARLARFHQKGIAFPTWPLSSAGAPSILDHNKSVRSCGWRNGALHFSLFACFRCATAAEKRGWPAYYLGLRQRGDRVRFWRRVGSEMEGGFVGVDGLRRRRWRRQSRWWARRLCSDTGFDRCRIGSR